MSFPIDLWPPQASAHAAQVDRLIGGFAALVFLLSAPVFLLMLVFAVRYRHERTADRTHPVHRNVWIEVSWSIIPFLAAIGFYVWALALFFALNNPPPDAFVIDVVAKQWMWKFQHPSGTREINALHVPTGTPVKLVMTSQDVIHSLYIPALRLKRDVLPGRYTTMWFKATHPGRYPLRCAEFCGTDHAVMGGGFTAMRPGDYARWLRASADNDGTLAAQGERLFRRVGCSGCHGPASSVHAPSLAGLYGAPTPLADGRVIVADDQYLHDSILQPNRDIAAGYRPIMPTFANLLDEGQVMQLVAYIKSLPDTTGEGQ